MKYTITRVSEFEYTGGGIWVVCGYAKDNNTGEEFFFDSSICSAYAEAVNIYTAYPYEEEGEDVSGCSFMPLPNYDELFRDSYDPDDSAEGQSLWDQVLASDAVAKTYASAYIGSFRSALSADR